MFLQLKNQAICLHLKEILCIREFRCSLIYDQQNNSIHLFIHFFLIARHHCHSVVDSQQSPINAKQVARSAARADFNKKNMCRAIARLIEVSKFSWREDH